MPLFLRSGEWKNLVIPINDGNLLLILVKGRESLTFSKSLNRSHSGMGIMHGLVSRDGNCALIPVNSGITIHIFEWNSLFISVKGRELLIFSKSLKRSHSRMGRVHQIPSMDGNRALIPIKLRLATHISRGNGLTFTESGMTLELYSLNPRILNLFLLWTGMVFLFPQHTRIVNFVSSSNTGVRLLAMT